MSNLAKTTKAVLETDTTREKVGMNLVKVGAGGLALYGFAAIMPFVAFVPLLVVLIVAGFFM